MVRTFSETDAMDLKRMHRSKLENLFVAPCRSYSASVVIKSKRKEVIVKQLFGFWIKILNICRNSWWIIKENSKMTNLEISV